MEERVQALRTTSRSRRRRTSPTRYWPWPPMLNMPQRNANATARPVRISGVVMSSVCWKLSAAACALGPRDPREEPVEARAVEDRPVGRERVLARRDEHDETTDEEGEQRGQDRREDALGLLGDVVALERRLPAPAGPRPHGSTGGSPDAAAPGRSLMPPPPAAAAARHQDAELLLGRGRRELADDLALVDDEDPVGEREDLLELERDEQDAAALVALLDEAPVHELDRADVEAARRLGGDQHRGLRSISRASTTFCWLPPERPPAGVCGAAAADVELLDQPGRPLDEAAREQPAEPRVGRRPVVVQARCSRRSRTRARARAAACPPGCDRGPRRSGRGRCRS